MPVKVLLPLLLLMLASGVYPQLIKDAEDDPNSEVVFNVSDTAVVENAFVNMTCGLKTNDSTMLVERIHLKFANSFTVRFRQVRGYRSRKNQEWTCAGGYQYVSDYMVCRTNNALLVKTRAQPNLAGKTLCLVEWGKFKPPNSRNTESFRGIKTVNLTVLWSSKVDYVVAESEKLRRVPPGVFGHSDVVLGKVNVSCGFVIDSHNADKPRMSGLDSWQSVYDNKIMNFDDVTTIHMKKTKVMTVADNGTRFECSIGNHTVRRQLRIRIPPRITKIWPLENSTVFVGSNISCETEGDPETNVDLVVKGGLKIWRMKGLSRVTLPISLNNPVGPYTVTCESISILGSIRKSWKINVKKLPMNVSLSEVRQQPAGSFLNLSCSTPDSDVEKIFFGFVGRSRLFELRVNPPQFMETSMYGRRLVKLLPYMSKGITVLKVSDSRIDVMIQLNREDNGNKVECTAVSKGKRGAVARNFLVSWPPSVKEVTFTNREMYAPIKKFSNTTVSCKFYVGNPAVPMEVVRPSARIGRRDLGRGYPFNSSPILTVLWVTQVSRAENGLNITCSLVNRTQNRTEVVAEKSIVASIQYPPSIVLFLPADGAAVLPSSLLRCVADSNPPALVVISARRGSAPLREVGRGQGEAEGRLEGADGRYFVTCEAWSKLGMVERSREVVLFARPPTVTLSLSSSPIPFKETLAISCSTAAGDPHLRELQLQFHGLSVTFGRFPISAANTRSASVNVLESGTTEPVLVSSTPFSVASGRLSVKRLSTVSNRIDVQMTALAFDHNQNVTCRAVGVDKGFNVTVQRKIQVSVKPNLAETWCCLPNGAKYSKKKANNFTIVAKVRVGIPAVAMNASFVSGEKMATPKLHGPVFVSRKTDKHGREFLTQLWSFTAFDIDEPLKKFEVYVGSKYRSFWLTWRQTMHASSSAKKLNGKKYQCQSVYRDYYDL